MGLWALAILTVPMYFIVTEGRKTSWGLENEALIVRCPQRGGAINPVEWYYSNTNERIPTQKRNRIFVSRDRLKFLPAKVEDSGIYTCVIRSPESIKTGSLNVTIYKRPPNCKIPDYMMYSTVDGSDKNSKITCPTIALYNWTAPVQWFKNCKALQGPRFRAHMSYLFIDKVSHVDEGDYTCRFTHTENGTNYIVTATRSFTVEEKGFSTFPVITNPPHNYTVEVEIGKTANIACSACFGTASQFVAVLWQINKTRIGSFGKARIQEEKGPNKSSSNGMICLTSLLRITGVTDKDFSLKYDCVAMNHHGVIRHPVRLRRKQPSKECLSQIAWQNWLNLLQTTILFLRGLCVIAWSQGIHHDRGISWPVSSNVFFMLRKLLKSGLSRMFLSSRRTLCHYIFPLSVSPRPCSPHGPPHPFTFLHVLSTLLPLSLGSFSPVSGFFIHPLHMLQGTLVLILGWKQ